MKDVIDTSQPNTVWHTTARVAPAKAPTKSEGAKVKIGVNGKYETKLVSELETVNYDGIDYYFVSYGVPAKDIYADVTVTVIKADETEGTTYAYSAADYADEILRMPEDAICTAELKALASALLVYGKNAAAALANGEAAEEITESIDWSGITARANEDEDGIVKLSKFSLELKSNIKLKIYFTIDAEIAYEEYEALPTDYKVFAYYGTNLIEYENSEVEPIEMAFSDEGNGVYCVEFEIVASKLSENFVISFELPGEGIAMDMELSALYYARAMVESGKDFAGYENLMKAIKLYSDAANAYVSSLAE